MILGRIITKNYYNLKARTRGIEPRRRSFGDRTGTLPVTRMFIITDILLDKLSNIANVDLPKGVEPLSLDSYSRVLPLNERRLLGDFGN